MESNLDILNDMRSYLNGNSRDLLRFLTEIHENGYQPLSREDLATIRSLNVYASSFDVRSLKTIVANNRDLLLRQDIIEHLNSDARYLLKGMGAIQINNDN
ncbi:hypothetical protein ACWE42_24440 [Sutcliffiella cohnii]